MLVNPLTHKLIKIGSTTYKKLLQLGLIYQFDKLPFDVYQEIFNHLNIIHIIILSLCNHCFNKYIKSLWYYQYFNQNKTSISGGGQFSYFIKNNNLYGCGHNYDKQLGLLNDIYYKPRVVLKDVYTISCGEHHGLILTSDGLYGLGSNSHGQIKPNTSSCHKLPQKIDIKDVLSIHCGIYHSLVKTRNHLYSFGDNSCGQLGLGHTYESLIPVNLDFFNNKQIIKIQCGYYHNLILIKQGLYGFGHNYYGQLGLTKKSNYINKPKQILFDDEVIDFDCGSIHSIVITTKGIYSSV